VSNCNSARFRLPEVRESVFDLNPKVVVSSRRLDMSDSTVAKDANPDMDINGDEWIGNAN
jgi:hypothetical protein